MTITAYCVVCKKKGQVMKDPVITKTARGGYMAKGQCPDCPTTMCAMMSEENAKKALESGEAKKDF
jgi:hypothetical protein